MTKMREIDRGFLAPHSGWGSCAAGDLTEDSGYLHVPPRGHDEHRTTRTPTTAGVDQVMKFRVAREVLADAVAWTARSLPPRPSVPVLAGIMLEVDGSQLSVSGFDYEVSARAEVDVQASESGRVLVPGRLLAEITRALPPHPVDLSAEGPRLSISCGNARFSLPTLPVEDYPSLPAMPSSAGVVDSDVDRKS